MKFSEDQLITWSRPVSTTEDQKCNNAIDQITAALRDKFGSAVSIFLQGSYRNNTNVRQNSDVDIVMRYDGVFYPDLQRLSESDKATYNAQKQSADYTFRQLKVDTESALKSAFTNEVERKNKCINVKGNSNRISADVIPCFVLTRFSTLETVEAEGIKFYSDTWEEIISYPNQHYSNGTEKTNRTYRLFKRMVRILKVINNQLIDQGKISDKLVSSFFIECLVYNVPDEEFISRNYSGTLRNVIVKIYNDMKDNAKYTEVNKLLWLFDDRSPRTRQNAIDFMQHCWTYLEYTI